MNTTPKHTPTPWTWIKSNASNFVHVETDTDHRQVATVNRGKLAEREANAAFIVRACNSHDALVTALEAIQARELGEWDNPALVAYGEIGAKADDILALCRAALKLAREGR